MGKKYSCGNTKNEICSYFSLEKERVDRIFSILENEGYSATGICYGIARAENKLWKFRHDSRFDNIVINEVRKYSYRVGDKRWDTKEGSGGNEN